MVTSTYPEAIKRVLAHEGGYTNHPSDPGGPTNWGITIHDARRYWKANASAIDVRNMPLAIAKNIYQSKYWQAQRCNELPAGVDYAIFDYGVNSGIGRSQKVLQRIVGVKVDGKIGQETLAAVALRDPVELVNAICDERLRSLKSLRTWPTFGRGWERRVREVRAYGTAVAREPLAPQPAPLPSSETRADKGVVPEPKGVKSVAKGTGVVAGAVASGTFLDWIYAHPWESVAIGAMLVVAIGIVVHMIDRVHKRRQETPMPDTPVVPIAKGAPL